MRSRSVQRTSRAIANGHPPARAPSQAHCPSLSPLETRLSMRAAAPHSPSPSIRQLIAALSIPISVTQGSAESGDYSVSGLTNGDLTFADIRKLEDIHNLDHQRLRQERRDRQPRIRPTPRRRRHRHSVERPTDHQRHHTRAPRPAAAARRPCPLAKQLTP